MKLWKWLYYLKPHRRKDEAGGPVVVRGFDISAIG